MATCLAALSTEGWAGRKPSRLLGMPGGKAPVAHGSHGSVVIQPGDFIPKGDEQEVRDQPSGSPKQATFEACWEHSRGQSGLLYLGRKDEGQSGRKCSSAELQVPSSSWCFF